jgi:hypothetical protein
VLRTIRGLFDQNYVDCHPSFESEETGERRSLADQYLVTLDVTIPGDAQKLADVIRDVLEDGAPDPARERDYWALQALVERDGWEYRDGRLVPVGGGVLERLTESVQEYNLTVLQADIERALASVDTDPADSITAASSMLESACKRVLDALGASYPRRQDAYHLYAAAADALGISPSPGTPEAIRRLNGALATAAQQIGAVRTGYGDAHGRSERDAKLESRHARLAIGAAATVAAYLLDT